MKKNIDLILDNYQSLATDRNDRLSGTYLNYLGSKLLKSHDFI